MSAFDIFLVSVVGYLIAGLALAIILCAIEPPPQPMGLLIMVVILFWPLALAFLLAVSLGDWFVNLILKAGEKLRTLVRRRQA